MKLLSWNVNGVRAVLGKGLLDWMSTADADVICLQETKAQPGLMRLGYDDEISARPAKTDVGHLVLAAA